MAPESSVSNNSILQAADENAHQGLKTLTAENKTGNSHRQPLATLENDAIPAEKNRVVVSLALLQAINTLDVERLRAELILLAGMDSKINACLENRLLVLGKDVIRYHEDTGSEYGDATGSDSEPEDDSEEEDEEEEVLPQSLKSKDQRPAPKQDKPISIGINEMTPRYAECENCHSHFDVTKNETGDCRWHPGHKEATYDEDFWCDMDDWPSPGHYIDDPEMAEGFVYSCCRKS
ncbi:hypothetical protein F5884DRAFT_346468 [Xylogone sp. PMI_703]|nr:hypothetical protein F5884DRAFT_346468 [Xylogone sp. PMI_703]